ncbi:Peptide transporter PTR2 [Escovopsis weberi]|uniref:Peptide transporter PTR2 n=1 Tax=Escovopsis weberi TaxID=150374 RepID=A0A0M8N7L4_ESCWE|nr:Peptide transporter PTR2 [Escovopsis weberi]
MSHEDTATELHETLNERVHHDIVNEADLKTDGMSVARTESEPTPDGEEPSEHEKRTLRRIGENLPFAAYLVAIVELTERFTFYGASGLFQNYISNAEDGSNGAKGLGLGHQAATGLNLFFQWFCYVTPILGAIISDQYLGKYKTIMFFCCVYWVGLVVLFATSLPVALEHGAGLPGYIVSIIIIGFGTGGIKSNIAPLIADQYTRTSMAIKTEATGERVIIDPAVTYQRIYLIFYWCINLGSLSLIATPFMEKYEGFWTAFLLCFLVFNFSIITLLARRKTYIVRPPQGSVITDAFKAIGMMISARNTDAAKPSWRAANGKTRAVPWNDHFVDELKRALIACKVFVFMPIFWVCYGQFSNNFVYQASQMEGHGMPNDFMQNFDPISILVFTPILDMFIYPFLRRMGLPLRPIMRISIGFFLAGLCLAYAAIVQHLIYSKGPCFNSPLCDAGKVDGKVMPNSVHIAIQTPAYVLIGLSELFASVTGLEYAYTKAPPSMKSFVQSVYLFTNAFGSALAEALVSVSVDPKFVWMYSGVGIASCAVAFIFWFLFHHYDDMEDELLALDKGNDAATAVEKAKAVEKADA